MKLLLGEKEIKALLRRLELLNREEGQGIMAQTLEVVYSLMNNMTIPMKGM